MIDSRTRSVRLARLARRVATIALFVVAARVVAATPSREERDNEVFQSLDVSFGTKGPFPEANGSARAARYRAFVRSRMSQDGFYDTVLPRLFGLLSSRLPLQGFRMPFVLDKAEHGNRAYFYLADYGTCSPKDMSRVSPWWDPGHAVWICNTSYRADRRIDHAEHAGPSDKTYCEAGAANCGCGERLLNCARDAEQLKQMLHDIEVEPIRTAQKIIQSDRPFSDMLTMNGSVRSDLSDFFYRRNHWFVTGEWPRVSPLAETELRPRDDEFNGGLLTTPHYLYWDDAPRVVVATIREDFLCASLVSTTVTAKAMFHPGASFENARYRFRPDLTTMTGCKECHTGLDYGLLAFSGFTRNNHGFRYVPAMQSDTSTRFYLRNAGDLRGEGPATPAFIGEMISKQPEFAACITHKVEEAVYGGYPVTPAVEHQLAKRFEKDRRFSSLFEDAVVERYLGPAALAP